MISQNGFVRFRSLGNVAQFNPKSEANRTHNGWWPFSIFYINPTVQGKTGHLVCPCSWLTVHVSGTVERKSARAQMMYWIKNTLVYSFLANYPK